MGAGYTCAKCLYIIINIIFLVSLHTLCSHVIIFVCIQMHTLIYIFFNYLKKDANVPGVIFKC